MVLSASAYTLLDLRNSLYNTQPHSLTVKYSNRETWCKTKIVQGLVQRIYCSTRTMILLNCLYQILGNGASFMGLGKERRQALLFFALVIVEEEV